MHVSHLALKCLARLSAVRLHLRGALWGVGASVACGTHYRDMEKCQG